MRRCNGSIKAGSPTPRRCSDCCCWRAGAQRDGVSPLVRRIVVSGRVQGVGFRYALADEARARGVDGWVRNLRDGTVEAVLAGTQPSVDAVIAWARVGPPAA